MNKFYFVFLIFFVVLFPSFSFAKDYDLYVDEKNTGDEDGSNKKPFRNLEKALKEISSRSNEARNIFVKNGKYEETVTLGNFVKITGESKKGVSIVGRVTMKNGSALRDLTIIDGSSAVLIESNADASLENCEIKNSRSIGIQAVPGSGKVTIRNSIISGGTGKGMYIEANRRVEISGNTIFGNKEEGIDIRSGVSGIINNNSIHSNGESGIEFIVGSSALSVSDNKLTGNGASGIASQYYRGDGKTGRTSISSNILSGNGKYGLDCAWPSGGRPSPTFWSTSIDFKGNVLDKNQIDTINVSCDITNVVDQEEEKKDNEIIDAPEQWGAANLKQFEEEIQNEEVPLNSESVEKEENIWEKARLIELQLDEIEMEINLRIRKINNRNRMIMFLWGADYENLASLKLEIAKIQKNKDRLSLLRESAEIEESRNMLNQFISQLETSIRSKNILITKYEKKFSLFSRFLQAMR